MDEPVVLELRWDGSPVARVSVPPPVELLVGVTVPAPVVCYECRLLDLNLLGAPALMRVGDVLGPWPFLAVEHVAWLRYVWPGAAAPLLAYYNIPCRRGRDDAMAVLAWDNVQGEAAIYCARHYTHSVDVKLVEAVEALTRVELYRTQLPPALYEMLVEAAKQHTNSFTAVDSTVTAENGIILPTRASPELAAMLIIPEESTTSITVTIDYPENIHTYRNIKHTLPPGKEKPNALLVVLKSRLFRL